MTIELIEETTGDQRTVAERIEEWELELKITRSYYGEPEPPRERTFTTVHEIELGVGDRWNPLKDFPIIKGSGHNGEPPTLIEVLEIYASDARDGAKEFEDFLSEYHSDPDPDTRRHYRRVWLKCTRLRKQLLRLLGDERLDDLLYRTDFS